jgi:23S rRNA pseudouridine2605 synthase
VTRGGKGIAGSRDRGIKGTPELQARSARMRLQKFLSDAGVASRRHAEELILAGRVLVNDEVVDTLPAFVDPEQDRVIVDGTRVRPQRLDYFMVHKPKGVVCTNRDPAGRVRAVDLLPDLPARLFPVGRLDEESTGLLLMTNDGELAQRITHPRYGVPKTYYAEVRGRVPDDLAATMKGGVFLAEGRARASGVEIEHRSSNRSSLLITLREGRNRQVRRMLAKLGHPVRKLKRVQIGPLTLRGLPVGSSRRLTPQELAALRAAVEAAGARETARSRRKAGRPKAAGMKPDGASRRKAAPERRKPAPQARRLIT